MSEAQPIRPGLLIPALLTLVGVIVLCGLGAWQLMRMDEKHAFISRLMAQAAGQPAAIPPSPQWPSLGPQTLDLTRVAASGRFIGEGFAGVRTTLASAERGSRQLTGFGHWIFQGFQLDTGSAILVNRGFVPEARFGEIAAASGPAQVSGFLRAPEARGSFTPPDQPAKREFYTRDPQAIAAALGIGPVAAFYLEAERRGNGLTPPAGVDARELIGRIPDNHLQYALTWFGLALTLLGVFFAFALQNRRKATPD